MYFIEYAQLHPEKLQISNFYTTDVEWGLGHSVSTIHSPASGTWENISHFSTHNKHCLATPTALEPNGD